MAVPDIEHRRKAVEKRARAVFDIEQTAPILAPGAVFHLSAEVMRHELHAIANAEHRRAEIENARIGVRRILSIHAGGAAAENDAGGMERRDLLRRQVKTDDLGIHLAFADSPRDDLRVLGTEIQDDDSAWRLACGTSCRHWSDREKADRPECRAG